MDREILVTVKLLDGDKVTFADNISETAQQAYDLAASAANTEYVVAVKTVWYCRPN